MLSKLIFVVIFASSCSTLQDRGGYAVDFQDNVVAGRCEAAQSRVPLEKSDTEFLRFYQGALGYAAYVSTVPITVGMDLLLFYRCQHGVCEKRDPQGKKFLETLFPTSTFTYQATKDFRCPDTSYYVQKVIEIAECYAHRGDAKSLRLAVDQLNYVVNEHNQGGPSCLKTRDYKLVLASLERIADALVAQTRRDSLKITVEK